MTAATYGTVMGHSTTPFLATLHVVQKLHHFVIAITLLTVK